MTFTNRTREDSICTVILAAGAGRRLGITSKALLPHPQSKNLAIRAITVALGAQTHPVLILGFNARHVDEQLVAVSPQIMEQTTVAYAKNWDSGLSSSFRTGVQTAANSGATVCAFLLVDQPHIGTGALKSVLDSHSPRQLTRGLVQSMPTHPVVMDIEDALRASELACGDAGAREFLKQENNRVRTVDISDLASAIDIDTPADLRAYMQRNRLLRF